MEEINPSQKIPILDIDNISTRYGNRSVLDGFSLTISSEEIVSLLGPSGCGKTTLLKCIAGLEEIITGSIKIYGNTVQTPTSSLPTRKRKLGMVFQDNTLFPHLTVYQNVIFGIPRNKQRTPETRERIAELLKALHLDLLAEKYPHEISGGQQQRTSLARSIAPRPKLLLMDEPFTGQDVGLKEQVIETVLRLLQKEKIATLVVTHDQNEAFKISHRVGVMKEYRLEQIGAPKEIYYHPTTRFTAGFIGTGTFIEAVYNERAAQSQWFVFREKIPNSDYIRPFKPRKGERVWVQLRPEDVILSGARSGKVGVSGVIHRKEFRTGNYLYQVRISDPSLPDKDDPILYSLMPADFEKSLGDQVTVHIVNKPFAFFREQPHLNL